MWKRLFDVLGATVGLVLLAPLLLAIALWVKLDSRGPIFFVDRRIGHGHVPQTRVAPCQAATNARASSATAAALLPGL